MSLHINDEDRYWHNPQDEDEDRGWWRFASPLRYVLFLLGAVALIVGIWYLFFGTTHHHSQTVPLIRADQTPYKIPSEDTSVSSVQNQDKLVYERLQTTAASDHVEHILPEPEPVAELPQPLQMTQAEETGDVVKMTPQYPDVETISHSVAQKLEEFPEETSLMAEEDPQVVEEDEDPISALISQASADEDSATVQHASAGQEKENKGATGHVQIQLGSLKSREDAESEWKRLSRKHADILGKLNHTVQKVDLGAEQGIFYRLRAGGFKTREKAKEACTEINGQKGACSVVNS